MEVGAISYQSNTIILDPDDVVHPVVVHALGRDDVAQLQLTRVELEVRAGAGGPGVPGVQLLTGVDVGGGDLEEVRQGVQVGETVLVPQHGARLAD